MNTKLPPSAAKVPPKGGVPVLSGPPPPRAEPIDGKRFAVVGGYKRGAERILVYGGGGIGKTTLASHAPNPVYLDADAGSHHLDVPRVEGVHDWASLRAAIQSTTCDGFGTLVIDTMTAIHEWGCAHVVATIPTERQATAKRIGDFGWNKGYEYNYDLHLHLLQDLDRHVRAGRNVILIAHDVTNEVPNPVGENFIRYEPHLYTDKKGTASIRNRIFQWVEHCFFIGYDVHAKDGKGKGGGTRRVWPSERPDHMAKSHTLSDPIPYESADDDTIWQLIFGGGAQ